MTGVNTLSVTAALRHSILTVPYLRDGFHGSRSQIRSRSNPGCFAEAEAAYRKALELTPQRIVTRACLSQSLLAQGRHEEALAEATREDEEAYRLWALAITHHVMGHGSESDAALRALIERHADEMAYQVADVHRARGEADPAFEWLDRAYVQRDGGPCEMSRQFRALHGDPRSGGFLQKMGFED